MLVALVHETQAHPWGVLGDTRQQGGAEAFDELLASAQGEGAHHLTQVQGVCRAQYRMGVLHQLADLFTQLQRPGRRYQAAPGTYQQRIASGCTQTRQGPAHGRRAQAQALGGASDAAFGKQHVQGDE